MSTDDKVLYGYLIVSSLFGLGFGIWGVIHERKLSSETIAGLFGATLFGFILLPLCIIVPITDWLERRFPWLRKKSPERVWFKW